MQMLFHILKHPGSTREFSSAASVPRVLPRPPWPGLARGTGRRLRTKVYGAAWCGEGWDIGDVLSPGSDSELKRSNDSAGFKAQKVGSIDPTTRAHPKPLLPF